MPRSSRRRRVIRPEPSGSLLQPITPHNSGPAPASRSSRVSQAPQFSRACHPTFPTIIVVSDMLPRIWKRKNEPAAHSPIPLTHSSPSKSPHAALEVSIPSSSDSNTPPATAAPTLVPTREAKTEFVQPHCSHLS